MAGGRLSSGRSAGGCVFFFSIFVVMVVSVGLVSGWWSVEQWSLCWWLCLRFVSAVMVVYVDLVSGWWSVEQWSRCCGCAFVLFVVVMVV